MKLTKKFIKENAGMTLKEAFPEAFETPFTGWAKDAGINHLWMVYFENSTVKYGFDASGAFCEKINTGYKYNSETERPATNEEVLEVLSKEAVKHYKVNDFVFDNWSNCKCRINQLTRFDFSYNSLFVLNENNSKTCLLNNGIWAQIIQPKKMTIQEIEKEFNIQVI